MTKTLQTVSYIALGVVVTAILVYLFGGLTVAKKNDVNDYNELKQKAVAEYLKV